MASVDITYLFQCVLIINKNSLSLENEVWELLTPTSYRFLMNFMISVVSPTMGAVLQVNCFVGIL